MGSGRDELAGRPDVNPGLPAAHPRIAGPLLPSGPGGVGRLVLRRAGIHVRPTLPGYFSTSRLAEREGFEPSEELPPHMISSHADSASLASLLIQGGEYERCTPLDPPAAQRRNESGASLLWRSFPALGCGTNARRRNESGASLLGAGPSASTH